MQPDTLLFDLDGLLVDTESFSKRSFDYAAEKHNLGDQEALFLSLVGTNEDHHKLRLDEELSQLVEPKIFRRDWLDQFHMLLDQETIELLPGVEETLKLANDLQIKCAVATSSGSSAAKRKLEETGISDYFLTVTCGDQVENSKPAPDIYIKAGKSVDADMSKSVGLEDSPNGVRAAIAAGLHVVQIPNLVAPTDELLQLSHQVLGSMHDVFNLLKSERLIES